MTMIFVFGYPADVGGANTELWHTVKLWRGMGRAVTLIPAGRTDARWRRRLEAIGCRTVACPPGGLERMPGLPGSLVAAMCNVQFLDAAEVFQQLHCRTVWFGCMNWLSPAERLCYRRHGLFDHHIFQSRYQQDQLVPQLTRFGYRPEQGRVIHGALGLDEFPFRPLPHAKGGAFTIGRMSRAAPEKFAPHTWNIYRRTGYPTRARVLGFSPAIAARLGVPPPWAECYPEGAWTSAEFLRTVHAMVFAGATAENWPRVGLEAMAAGVPLVVDNRGGWREMIRHGQTGFLCNSTDDFARHTARLARDEPWRMHIAHQARRDLEQRLAEAGSLAREWKKLLGD